MRQSIAFAHDDHPAGDDERPQGWWIVSVFDECEACDRPLVELTVELMDSPGERVSVHLGPGTVRKLQQGLELALREIGEAPRD